MKIEQIKIKNYKVFEDTHITNLGGMAVFLGTNGSGKSTLFDLFSFLSDALHNNINVALNRRGGFKEVITRGKNPQSEPIEIEIKFRNVAQNQNRQPLVTYFLKVKSERGKAYVDREILRYRRGATGAPWHFLDFSQGEGSVVINEDEYDKKGAEQNRTNQKVTSPDILALKGLGQFEEFQTISNFRALLEHWHISNFVLEEGRTIQDTGVAEHLSERGENLAQVTQYIHENHPEVFQTILEKLPQRIPGIDHVEAKETEDGRIVLRFQDESFKDPFIARYVSDGTLKMFAYMVLLHDPEPHPLLCIEEPENYLHPDLLLQLAEEIREYGERGGQVFVSTHSPDFVNGVNADELYFMTKKDGKSKVQRAADNEMVFELAQQNQLGWLWRNQYIQGANLQ